MLMNIPSLHFDNRTQICSLLSEHGILCVKEVPLDADNRSLREIGALLGRESTRGLPLRSNGVENGCVVRVQSLASQPLDQFGKRLISASAHAFPLHTDESFCAYPANWVLLHCWRDDPDGGRSRWARVDELTAAVKSLRVDNNFNLPYSIGDRPIIDAKRRLRFNAAEVEGEIALRDRVASCREQRLIDGVDSLLNQYAGDCQLHPRELLIIDNHRVAHGRTAFDPRNGRLFKRLRIE